MKHGFRTMSLRVKMPLLFCSLLFIIISLFGFILYMYYDGTFQQSYKDSFQMAMTTNANGVRETLSELENAINVINDNDNSYIGFSSENISLAANLIINTNPEEKDFDFYDMLMDKKLCEQTTEVLFKSAASYAVIIDDEYPISTYLLNYNKGKSGFFKDATVCDSIWYKKALELDGDMYWFADNEFPDRFFIAKLLKYQIYTPTEEYKVKNLGTVVLSIDYSTLNKKIDISQMPENTQISIMGTDGTLIYCNQDSDVLIPENALTEVLENVPEGIACYYDYEEKHFLIQKNELSSGLTMLTVLPSDIIRTMSTQMLATLLVLLAVTLVVGVVLMLTLSSAIVAPIVQLSQQMEKGVIELVNDRRYSGDEIDILYCRYNQMQKKIQEMLRDIWNSAEKQKNAELRLLQAQINPHFVYNTLGTISCQALLAGENLIAEQLNMLAQIMRYSTRDPNSLVPLEKEIQITRQYVQIQELNNKNVEFVFSVSAECNNVLIPKLIIQPLVENSIIHGMYPGKNNGRIAIDVQARESGIITITVSDNGCGVDAEAINNYIRGKAKMHADHDSLGVKNVYDRIRNVYGDNGKLEYRMSLSRETLAIIEIKLE